MDCDDGFAAMDALGDALAADLLGDDGGVELMETALAEMKMDKESEAEAKAEWQSALAEMQAAKQKREEEAAATAAAEQEPVQMTLDEVVRRIKSGARVLVMAGAGLSVSAGIPDFRTPGSGLYDNLAKYKLPYPTAIFELNYFRNNPQPFYTLAREMFPGKWRPTAGHYFIRLLEEKGALLRMFSQNIDTLERVAGVSPDKIVEAHGSFGEAACIQCEEEFPISRLEEHVFAESGPTVPRCVTCDGLVKPRITFFGENLPDRFFDRLPDLKEAEVLLVLGTSLAVMPFASLVGRVGPHVPRVLINREPVGPFEEPSIRDVLMLGDCDDQVQLLVELLGWSEDFERVKLAGRDEFDRCTGK